MTKPKISLTTEIFKTHNYYIFEIATKNVSDFSDIKIENNPYKIKSLQNNK